jgi:hypothetical protein
MVHPPLGIRPQIFVAFLFIHIPAKSSVAHYTFLPPLHTISTDHNSSHNTEKFSLIHYQTV